eukprot:GHVT01029459.1.p1 GENE.GHVT01029459.1~~GHVT01029459.1.p1  ORF type:complete len:111 (-),score=7.62 GHVT01029459.1:634-966(-)
MRHWASSASPALGGRVGLRYRKEPLPNDRLFVAARGQMEKIAAIISSNCPTTASWHGTSVHRFARVPPGALLVVARRRLANSSSSKRRGNDKWHGFGGRGAASSHTLRCR